MFYMCRKESKLKNVGGICRLIKKKKKKQGKFLCPMCYKNCHVPDKILSCPKIATQEFTWKKFFELTQYKKEEKKAREVFVPKLLRNLSHLWKNFELTQYRRRRKSKGTFSAQCVTKIVTYMKKFWADSI